MKTAFLPFLIVVTMPIADHSLGTAQVWEVMPVVIEAKKEWANSRRCEVTPDGEQVLWERMQQTRPTLETKSVKCDLTWNKEKTVIKDYQASFMAFGPTRQNCLAMQPLCERFRCPRVFRIQTVEASK